MCVSISLCAFMCTTFMQLSSGDQISWSWCYGWLWAVWCGCWELNPGPLKNQWLLFTAELSLQLYFLFSYIPTIWVDIKFQVGSYFHILKTMVLGKFIARSLNLQNRNYITDPAFHSESYVLFHILEVMALRFLSKQMSCKILLFHYFSSAMSSPSIDEWPSG